MNIKIYRTSEAAVLPVYKTAGSAGCDLTAFITEPLSVAPQGIVRIPTGLHVAIPLGFEAQVRPRSGMTSRGLIVPIGTVDSDYRGEIHVQLFNLNSFILTIQPGERVAQLVVVPVTRVSWDEVAKLEDLGATARGAGGFGSTGR